MYKAHWGVSFSNITLPFSPLLTYILYFGHTDQLVSLRVQQSLILILKLLVSYRLHLYPRAFVAHSLIFIILLFFFIVTVWCSFSLWRGALFAFLSSVQSLSHVWLFPTSWTAACQASLSITQSWSLLELMSIGQWFHPTISSSIGPFSCLQSFPASGSFPMSQLFTWGGSSIGVSASASVLPMNTQDWSPLGWTGWISLQSRGLSRVLQHHSSKASILWRSAFLIVQLSHPYMTTGETIALTGWNFVSKVMSLSLIIIIICFLICCLG